MENNTLPADIESKIFNVLFSYTNHKRTAAVKELAELFATEWKVKHDQLQVEFTEFKNISANETRLMLDDHAKLQQQYNQMKDRADKMEQLIEELLETHENEALLDRNIFNKFQNLMDGAE